MKLNNIFRATLNSVNREGNSSLLNSKIRITWKINEKSNCEKLQWKSLMPLFQNIANIELEKSLRFKIWAESFS